MVGTLSEQVIDAEEKARWKSTGRVPPAVPPSPPPGDGDGPPPQPSGEPARPVIGNAYLGMAAFLGAEAMFFAGLIGAFLVFRYGSQIWPPPFQPRLPLAVTTANTAVLLCSAWTMSRATRAWKRGDRPGFSRWLLWTSVLGVVFLLIQGSEWIRLIHFGLTISSGVYGGTFYTLIGFHGLHVLGAVVWLVALGAVLRRAPFTERCRTRLELCGIYWYFVVGLWPILFGLVYLG